jgi:hypothetical protein
MRRATGLLKTPAGENPVELRAHFRRARLRRVVGAMSDRLVITHSTVRHHDSK